jgi:hypothetical protein
MGLKGYRLWVMGQLDSTSRAPPRAHQLMHVRHQLRVRQHLAERLAVRLLPSQETGEVLAVALQVCI